MQQTLPMGPVIRASVPLMVRRSVPLWAAAALLLAAVRVLGGPLEGRLAVSAGPVGALLTGLWVLSAWRAAGPALAGPATIDAVSAAGRLPTGLALAPAALAAALPVPVLAALGGHAAHAPAWWLAGALGLVAASPGGPAGVAGATAAAALAGLLGGLPPVAALLAAGLAFIALAGPAWHRGLQRRAHAEADAPVPPVPLLLRHTWQHASTGLAGAGTGALVAIGWMAVAAGDQGGLPDSWRGPAVALLAGFAGTGMAVAMVEADARTPLAVPRGARMAACLALCAPFLLALGLAAHHGGALLRGLLVGLGLAAAVAGLRPRDPDRGFPWGAYALAACGVVLLAALPWPAPAVLALGAAALPLWWGRPAAA